ncbi:hypothetical protein F4818DRAFT_436782 [Hypoxylon cercidicola]|nr:hypothetical protein F4818DRAFT_436782 [Hypoxylon cercidicola]
MVLIGDAAHKTSINQASGANIGFESAASLANHLHALVQANPNPNAEALTRTLAAYQAERQRRATFWVYLAVGSLGALLWKNWKARFRFMYAVGFRQYLYGQYWLIDKFVSLVVANSLKLDYVPLEDEHRSVFPWATGDALPNLAQGPGWRVIGTYWVIAGLGVAGAVTAWVYRR